MSTKTNASTKAVLAFENGRVFEGISFGAPIEKVGEVVFNTAMSGYQEIITDPSYKGQMVLMTATQIGNTGINALDNESSGLHLEGFIVKEYCHEPSNWRSEQTLRTFLEEANIPAIEGIDTREITKMLRDEGSLKAVLSTDNVNIEDLIEKAKNAPSLAGQNMAELVSTEIKYDFSEKPTLKKFHVVAFDLGIKKSILQNLVSRGCLVTVVPWNTKAADVLNLKPDGIFFSNGPGDPAAVKDTIEAAKELIGQKPIFGICLGHQILAHALGGTTSKLKFGHHGANHPVLNKKTKSIEITSQNHNFVVDLQSFSGTNIEMTHVNLNDQTLEGFKDASNQLFAVQYHPESSPGPLDSVYLFDEFLKSMEND